MSMAGARDRMRAGFRGRVRALRSRNFRLFFIGQLISNSGNWLTLVALTLLVLHLTNSGVDVGLLSACQFGPILVLSAFAGLVADRSNKLRLLKFTQAGEMLQSVALAGLAFLHHPPLGALYVTALAGGCLLAFDNPVRRSFVTEMVPEDQVPNAVTLYSAGALVGALILADRRTVSVRSIVVGAGAFGVTMLGLAAAPNVAATLPIVALVGVSSIAFMTATTAIVQVRADPRMHGRVLALQTVLLVGTTPVGGPIMGAVADAFGARVPLVIGGVAAGLAALFGLLVGRRVLPRDEPAPA